MVRGNWLAGTLGGSDLRRGTVGEPAPAPDSVYDLASLTKVILTSTLLADEWLRSGLGWVEYLAQPVAPVVPELRGTWLESTTLGEFWEHRSGVCPHKKLFEPERRPVGPSDTRAQLWQTALASTLAEAPGVRGTTLYSDLGFLILGLMLERRHGTTLDALWEKWKRAHGLPLGSLSFGVAPWDAARFARTQATEARHPRGEVNDDKAASLGGVAAHAGLFGDADEVWAWLKALVDWRDQEPRLATWLTPPTSHYDGGSAGRFHGGWDRPALSPESQGGYPTPPGVIGHLGYTGTALWWQPETRRAAILLTNRVHPRHTPASQLEVKKIRQRFFSEFWQGTL